MAPANYSPEAATVLQMLAQDHIHLEQYLDFLRNTMFRQTLLCLAQQQPNYKMEPRQIQKFLIASPAKPEAAAPDIHSTEPENFVGPGGVTLASKDPLVKAAMVYLSEVWPKAVPFADLCTLARRRLGLETKAEEKDLGGDRDNVLCRAMRASVLWSSVVRTPSVT